MPARVTKLRLLSRCVGPRENLTVANLHFAVYDTSMFGNVEQLFLSLSADEPTSMTGILGLCEC